MEIDVQALEELAARLDKEANYLSGGGTGTPMWLAQEADLPCGAFGTWRTASEMEASHREARQHVAQFFQDVVELMRQTAALARQSAANHRQNEQAIKHSIANRQAALDADATAA